MKSVNNKIILFIFCTAVLAMGVSSCKKDNHTPPTIKFKTGGSYISADDSVAKGATIAVGIIADKTEDELKTLNVSYAFDGAGSTTTKDNYTLASSETEHYEKDYTITARSTAGTEKWVFTITDRDGNISSVSFTLTVH